MNGCFDHVVRPKSVAVGEVEGPELDEDEEAGDRKVQRMQDPRTPSETEVEEHNLAHLPYRSWCRHCVKGRGKELPHRRLEDLVGMPELHADLCFLGEEGEPSNTIPVLVVQERTTRMTMAAALPSKGSSAYISKRVVAFMKEVGVAHGDVLVKSDHEPAVRTILDDVGRMRASEG